MSAFVSSLLTGGAKDASSRPETPTRNSFINPVSTPQGSPSKRTIPPGANELPDAFDNALKLSTPVLERPRLERPLSVINTPLSPGKSNLNESSPNVEDSVLHKGVTSTGSPLKKSHGRENTPPVSRLGAADSPYQQSHAAVSRHELYQTKEKPMTPRNKFNTQRALTPEELEILQRPNVRRLVNVTQLCKLDKATAVGAC